MDTFNPSPAAFDAIFEHLLDPQNHLLSIARGYNTSLRALNDWLDAPEVRRCRDLLDKNLASRARTLALANLPAAIITANQILEDFQAVKDLPATDDPQAVERHRRLCETARRAASLLHRLSLPEGATRKVISSSPEPLPEGGVGVGSSDPRSTETGRTNPSIPKQENPQHTPSPSASDGDANAPIPSTTPDRSHPSYQSYESYPSSHPHPTNIPILTEAQLEELDYHRAAIEALLGPPDAATLGELSPADPVEDPDPHLLTTAP